MWDLLWLRMADFFVLSFGASLDINEILSDRLWEMKCTWVLGLEESKKLSEEPINVVVSSATTLPALA